MDYVQNQSCLSTILRTEREADAPIRTINAHTTTQAVESALSILLDVHERHALQSVQTPAYGRDVKPETISQRRHVVLAFDEDPHHIQACLTRKLTEHFTQGRRNPWLF